MVRELAAASGMIPREGESSVEKWFERESVEKAGNGQELLDVPIAPRRRLTWADFVSSFA